jgi:hypothetical protein
MAARKRTTPKIYELYVELEGVQSPIWRRLLARAAPPDDVGGVYGYAEFLSTIKDPKHDEHDQMLAWVGGVFDPEGFDLNAINRALRFGALWARMRRPFAVQPRCDGASRAGGSEGSRRRCGLADGGPGV